MSHPTEDEHDPTQPLESPADWEVEREAEAARHNGLHPLTDSPDVYFNHSRLRAPQVLSPLPPAADAEAELTALIGECRSFVREIAFHSARLSPSATDRIGFMDAACRMARTGAKLGEAVAQVRGGGNGAERRQLVKFEYSRSESASDPAAPPPGAAA
ncbi:MAG: hypothetical protein GC166_09755 [Alphaproteobacteria bacterium]|nr:hypothetical protein [Alphaproteobacteria bacterium]